jgi:hemoglobin
MFRANCATGGIVLAARAEFREVCDSFNGPAKGLAVMCNASHGCCCSMIISAPRGWQTLLACLLVLPAAASQTLEAQIPRAGADQAPPIEQLEAPVPGSLYLRMGGAHNVRALAADMIDHVSRDPRTERPFEKVNLARVKSLLAVKFCELTGGGCKYTGDSMRDVHAGLGITEAEFYGLVDILRDSMRRHGIGLRERNEFLRILAPMKRDVVER